MKKFLFILVIISSLFTHVDAQQFTARTSVDWDQWQENKWGYIYSGDWIYAVKGERTYTHVEHHSFLSSTLSTVWYQKPVGNARDFYYRFNYRELGLHKLSRKEWKQVKKNGGWLETSCTFEYYITDQYQTLRSALDAHSWPCAKYYCAPGKPAVLKSEKVSVRVHMTDDDEVRTLNFFFSDGGFALTVYWNYSGNKMTYLY